MIKIEKVKDCGSDVGIYNISISNAVMISENATDGLTNGDVIKIMFPDVEVKEKNNGYEVYFGVGTAIQFFNHQWWNAPYKAGGEEV